MAFHDPLRNYTQIDNTNYLRPRVQNFLQKVDKPTSFYNAIRSLVQIREVLLAIEDMGRLNEVRYLEYYISAVQWLNGQVTINNNQTISQITNYDDINDTNSLTFEAYATWTLSQFRQQAIFLNAEAMKAVIKTEIVQGIVSNVQSGLEDDFNRILQDNRTSVVESLGGLATEKESSLNSLFNSWTESLRTQAQDAKTDFEEARSLANWSAFYRERVRAYRKELFGLEWPENAMAKKWTAYRSHRSQNKFWSKARWTTKAEAVHGLLRCIRKATHILWSKFTSYSGKRTLWFILLTLGVALFVAINFIAVYGSDSTVWGINLGKLRPTHGDTQIFAKISIFIGILFIPTIGYSFANKNYRIYSNLLEQYRHREVVAETIQGILARKRGDDEDEKVRQELANVASIALFEQKTVGHLSKNEATTASLMDIARLFRS